MSQKLKMSKEAIDAFLAEVFPQMATGATPFTIEGVRAGGAAVRCAYDERQLRPGGTLSGPTMMALADYAAYVAILAQIGPVALAVTTNLNISFLRKPAPGDLVADCELLKLGKRLAVADVRLHTAGDERLVAHAQVTYSIPAQE